MRCRFLVPLIAIFVGSTAITAFAYSSCGETTETIILKGRVESRSHSASVRVQLLYATKPKQEQPGESAEVTVENGRFTIQIPFLTRDSEKVIFASARDKCRKPKTVVLTLLEGDQNEERDRISLDMAKDFTKADAAAYKPRLDIVLHDVR